MTPELKTSTSEPAAPAPAASAAARDNAIALADAAMAEWPEKTPEQFLRSTLKELKAVLVAQQTLDEMGIPAGGVGESAVTVAPEAMQAVIDAGLVAVANQDEFELHGREARKLADVREKVGKAVLAQLHCAQRVETLEQSQPGGLKNIFTFGRAAKEYRMMLGFSRNQLETAKAAEKEAMGEFKSAVQHAVAYSGYVKLNGNFVKLTPAGQALLASEAKEDLLSRVMMQTKVAEN